MLRMYEHMTDICAPYLRISMMLHSEGNLCESDSKSVNELVRKRVTHRDAKNLEIHPAKLSSIPLTFPSFSNIPQY